MTFPVWMLLGFALWTLLILLFTVGVYRWQRILTGRVEIKEFRADIVQGEEWYRRAMRAHANCVENLPVFGVIVFALYVSDMAGMMINASAAVILVARICQSLTHIVLTQTNRVATFRFGCFFIQIVCFFFLSGTIVKNNWFS